MALDYRHVLQSDSGISNIQCSYLGFNFAAITLLSHTVFATTEVFIISWDELFPVVRSPCLVLSASVTSGFTSRSSVNL